MNHAKPIQQNEKAPRADNGGAPITNLTYGFQYNRLRRQSKPLFDNLDQAVAWLLEQEAK